MRTSSLDEREIQLLLVALRYWRTHRSDGIIRRTDPHLTPDLVDVLVAKLTSCLPPAERDPRQRTLFTAEPPTTTTDRPPSGPESRSKPSSRR